MFHFGTNHTPNGGTASCRSAVFFGLEEDGKRTKRMGEESERKKTGIGEDGERDSEEDGRGLREEERGRRGWERESGRMGEDFERRKEDGEDGEWTRRKKKRDFEKGETRL